MQPKALEVLTDSLNLVLDIEKNLGQRKLDGVGPEYHKEIDNLRLKSLNLKRYKDKRDFSQREGVIEYTDWLYDIRRGIPLTGNSIILLNNIRIERIPRAKEIFSEESYDHILKKRKNLDMLFSRAYLHNYTSGMYVVGHTVPYYEEINEFIDELGRAHNLLAPKE